jgi:hypothetical protein
MQRNHALIALIALASSVAACASTSTTESSLPRLDQLSSTGAAIEISAEGGIAALSVNHVVRHDDRTYAFSQRHICNAVCPAALDSASGTLSAAIIDSMFKAALPAAFALKDDYGITRNGADMMAYVVRVTAGGSTKTIKADDGSMPPELRQIVSGVRQTIDAARK